MRLSSPRWIARFALALLAPALLVAAGCGDDPPPAADGGVDIDGGDPDADPDAGDAGAPVGTGVEVTIHDPYGVLEEGNRLILNAADGSLLEEIVVDVAGVYGFDEVEEGGSISVVYVWDGALATVRTITGIAPGDRLELGTTQFLTSQGDPVGSITVTYPPIAGPVSYYAASVGCGAFDFGGGALQLPLFDDTPDQADVLLIASGSEGVLAAAHIPDVEILSGGDYDLETWEVPQVEQELSITDMPDFGWSLIMESYLDCLRVGFGNDTTEGATTTARFSIPEGAGEKSRYSIRFFGPQIGGENTISVVTGLSEAPVPQVAVDADEMVPWVTSATLTGRDLSVELAWTPTEIDGVELGLGAVFGAPRWSIVSKDGNARLPELPADFADAIDLAELTRAGALVHESSRYDGYADLRAQADDHMFELQMGATDRSGRSWVPLAAP